MPKPDLSYALGLEPVEAVRYFRSKGIAVTENWHDLWQEAQARAFTVTGITKLDLMQDIRGAVDTAIKEGKTEQWFLNELTPILKKKGWWGKKEVTAPDTGEVRYVRQGSPARLKLIYRQNTQSATSNSSKTRIPPRTCAISPYLIRRPGPPMPPCTTWFSGLTILSGAQCIRRTAGIAGAASPPIPNPV